jgi:hypothetical protein
MGMLLPKLGITGWLLIFCGLTVAFGGMQTLRLKAEKAEYAAFRADVKRVGDEQEKRTKETIARNQKAKESADVQNKRLLAANDALTRSLHNARAGSGYLPAPAPGAGDTACFSRPELERALRQLDEGISGLIGEGDQARITIDTFRDWAKGQVK